jgi:SAM-dependent methyltransferase
MNVTLLDYIIDLKVVRELSELNGLKTGDITIIEDDIFSYLPKENYDLVCSFGFIEHFTDLEYVLRTHMKFLRPGGLLLITLPNFLGVNGFLQKVFDPRNLTIHNLAVMDLALLKDKMSIIGMQNIQVEYYPSTQVWLEGSHDRFFIVRLIVRIVDESVRFLAKIFGKQTRWFSNSIVIFAKKPFE